MEADHFSRADRALAHIPPVRGIGCAEFHCESGRLAMPDFACDLIWCAGELMVVGPMTKGLRHQRARRGRQRRGAICAVGACPETGFFGVSPPSIAAFAPA